MQYNLFDDDELDRLISVAVTEQMRRLALEIHCRLWPSYQHLIPEYTRPRLNPLNQAIFSMLSQRTKDDRAHLAYRRLCHGRKSWDSILDLPMEQTQQLIAVATYPEQKVRYLYDLLNRVASWTDRSQLSLDILFDLPNSRAQELLMQIPGIGPKTSAATLLFSTVKRPVLPVDTHFRRIITRIGLIPSNLTTRQVHVIARAQLPQEWESIDLERHYYLMKRHGQICCTAIDPKCHACPLIDICRYG